MKCNRCGLEIADEKDAAPAFYRIDAVFRHATWRLCLAALRDEVARLQDENRQLRAGAFEFDAIVRYEGDGRRMYASASTWLFPGEELGVIRKA